MVFCMNFKTSFTCCFLMLLCSAEVHFEFFEGCKSVPFSLLWSIRYLPGDGGCCKKRCCLGCLVSDFFFITSTCFFRISICCVIGRFCCLSPLFILLKVFLMFVFFYGINLLYLFLSAEQLHMIFVLYLVLVLLVKVLPR